MGYTSWLAGCLVASERQTLRRRLGSFWSELVQAGTLAATVQLFENWCHVLLCPA